MAYYSVPWKQTFLFVEIRKTTISIKFVLKQKNFHQAFLVLGLFVVIETIHPILNSQNKGFRQNNANEMEY